MAFLEGLWKVLKRAVTGFVNNDAMTLAASVAFYTVLSLSPLVVILVGVSGTIAEDSEQFIVRRTGELVGPRVQEGVRLVLDNARSNSHTGFWSTLVGAGILLFTATAVFVQIQHSMNRIWGVQARRGQSLWFWIRTRLVSLIMIVLTGTILLASLILSTLINLIFKGDGAFYEAIHFAAALVLFMLLFIILFRVVPDVDFRWRDAAGGATVTAILFALGKLAIGHYLGYTGFGSAYGAAGTFVAFLLWVYYASFIVFFGVELTVGYVKQIGARYKPQPHAEWIPSACPEGE